MIREVLTYLNLKLETEGWFNTIHFLAEKVKKEQAVYPAIYNIMGEYAEINLDVTGSLCYWRKNGSVTFSQEANPTQAKGLQYNVVMPIKLICFVPKSLPYNDAYFADNLALDIIDLLTTTNSALKGLLLAKSARVVAKGYNTDARSVAIEEYDNVNYVPRYTHAYFSVDFEVEVKTNQYCEC